MKPRVESAPSKAYPLEDESLLIYDRGLSPRISMDQAFGLSEVLERRWNASKG